MCTSFSPAPRRRGLISDFLVANKGWLAGHGTEARELIEAWSDSITYLPHPPHPGGSHHGQGHRRHPEFPGLDAGGRDPLLGGR